MHALNFFTRNLAGFSIALALLAAHQAADAQASPPATAGARPLDAQQLAALDARASELIGKDVKNPQGEDLGKIADLIMDPEHARVRYAVLAYGGFLGLGNRLAAFPLTLFRPGREEGELALNVSRQQLEKAPGYDADNWPGAVSEEYRGDVDRFFLKDDEVVRDESGSRLVHASDLIGKSVSDGGNRNLGSIEDLVVNLGNGQIRYAVLKRDSGLAMDQKAGGKLVPLPMAAFRFPSRPDLPAFLLLDQDRVAKARAFDEDSWPDLNSAQARSEVEGWLSQFPAGDAPRAARPAVPASGAGAGVGAGASGKD